MKSIPEIAKIPPEKVQKIMNLEKDLDVVLIAYEKPSNLSTLPGKDLDKIQALEKELGIKLIAYS